jgi:hypothetical protein
MLSAMHLVYNWPARINRTSAAIKNVSVKRIGPKVRAFRINHDRRIGFADLVRRQNITDCDMFFFSLTGREWVLERRISLFACRRRTIDASLRNTEISGIDNLMTCGEPKGLHFLQDPKEIPSPLPCKQSWHVFHHERDRLNFAERPHKRGDHVSLIRICLPQTSGRKRLAWRAPAYQFHLAPVPRQIYFPNIRYQDVGIGMACEGRDPKGIDFHRTDRLNFRLPKAERHAARACK